MVEIQPLTIDNYKEVARLDQASFSCEAWSETLFLNEINDKSKYYAVYIDDGKVVGFGGYAQILDEGNILNIAVDDKYRRRGIATKLLNILINNGAQNGIKAFTLEVRISNNGARLLYEKAGFKLVGIRKRFYPDKEDACIYWLYM